MYACVGDIHATISPFWEGKRYNLFPHMAPVAMVWPLLFLERFLMQGSVETECTSLFCQEVLLSGVDNASRQYLDYVTPKLCLLHYYFFILFCRYCGSRMNVNNQTCACLYFQWGPQWRRRNRQQARKLSSPQCLCTQVTPSTIPLSTYTVHSVALPPLSSLTLTRSSHRFLYTTSPQSSLPLFAKANWTQQQKQD